MQWRTLVSTQWPFDILSHRQYFKISGRL